MRIVIAGAGIGGLTAAVAAAGAGHEVRVLERAPELRPLGAGLTVQPNALSALDRIGLGGAVRTAGARLRGAQIRHFRGRVLVEVSAEQMVAVAGELPVGIHRGELQRILRAAVPPADLRLGSAVRGFVDRDGGVEVELEGGEAYGGDGLVGADGIHSAVRAGLVDATAPEAILRNDIRDRPPVERWGQGRVTLLGDAAHPMTPNLGQGACQAIEDAVALGRHLDGATDPRTAFRAYERERLARANRFVRRARRLGRIAQLDNALLRGARDLLLRMRPASSTLETMRWMFDPALPT